ncbi:MAG: hypothetical protein DMC62_00845 [Verrucomicrobia bacterium]|nr:MAG: hypothetical protein DMC62_00845 [Verrucomicrobiota bacterium]
MASESGARSCCRAIDSAISHSTKATHDCRLGSRRLLSTCDPSGWRYLWLAAHERWQDLVLDCRWYRPRRHHGSVEHDEPARVMEAVNNDFRSIFGARSFMTAMCVAVNPVTGRATVVGAGHPPVLIARHGGGTGSIASVAPPLGLIEHPEFTETTIDLDSGDAFLLYTDGLFGAARGERLRLTPERLEKMLDHSAPNAEALLRGILNQVVPENGKDALPDDLAALAVRRMA